MRWYQACTPLLLGVGITYAIWPRETLVGILGIPSATPQAVQAWRDVGLSVAIAGPAITWSLQRKASAKSLLTGMAKILNGGLMSVSLLHLAILGRFPRWFYRCCVCVLVCVLVCFVLALHVFHVHNTCAYHAHARITRATLCVVSICTHTGPMWYEGQGGKYLGASLGVWGATGLATLVGVKESLEGVVAGP